MKVKELVAKINECYPYNKLLAIKTIKEFCDGERKNTKKIYLREAKDIIDENWHTKSNGKNVVNTLIKQEYISNHKFL